MEDLTKDQLHEAYQLAKTMGNAFRAFRRAEEITLQVIKFQQNIDQYAALVEQRKAEAVSATAETADLVAKLGVARAELNQETARLAQFRKDELAKIQAELASSRDDADRKISTFQMEVSDAKQASEDARKEHAGLLAALDAEIASTQGVLSTLQGEISALKQKFA